MYKMFEKQKFFFGVSNNLNMFFADFTNTKEQSYKNWMIMMKLKHIFCKKKKKNCLRLVGNKQKVYRP